MTVPADPAIVIAAGISAIPASIAALASWRTARQVKPTNGHRLAEIVEEHKHLSHANAEKLASLVAKLEAHVLDQRAHAREQHEHFAAAEGTCPSCLGLTEGDD